MQDVSRYWATEYDWRKVEARLNALPQFITKIDGLDIHFIHVRSKHANALPLIVTHGWPGSIIHQLKIVDPLVNPTAHGGSAADAFDVVFPSMPGYGFSGKPDKAGWDPARMARAWVALMKRLGYTKFVAQGGDWGAIVTDVMAAQGHPELVGIHTNMPGAVPPEVSKAIATGGPAPSGLSDEESRAFQKLKNLFAPACTTRTRWRTRPQTLYGIADSPVGLAAWLMTCDGDAKPAALITAALHTPTEGQPRATHARRRARQHHAVLADEHGGLLGSPLLGEQVPVLRFQERHYPCRGERFPGRVLPNPRNWAERAYPKLIHYNKVDKGGHFPAWEQPKLFVEELRAGFRSLRT